MSRINDTQTSRTSLGSHDRKLRYRALLENLSSLDEGISDNVERIEKTAIAVQEAQSLLADGGVEERVRNPGEGYLDSRVLRATSDLAVRCSEAVSGNANNYDMHEFAQHIREYPNFWETTFPFEVPAVSYLFGTFSPTPAEQRPRAVRKRVEKQQVAALKEPERVDKLDKTEEGSEMVSRVNKFICKTYRNTARPLSYFHTVLDPHSFSRTVENIYLVSFLVKDGLVAVELDEENELPFITPIPAKQQEQSDNSEENQFIVSIDMKRWQELVEVFGIQEAMMVLKRG